MISSKCFVTGSALDRYREPTWPPCYLALDYVMAHKYKYKYKNLKIGQADGEKRFNLDDDVCTRKINLQGYLVHQSFAERNVSVSVKRK